VAVAFALSRSQSQAKDGVFPLLGTEFWAEVVVKRAIERATHILDLIDAKWPALEGTH